MKSLSLRTIAALLLTTGLAACGSKASYDVSGTLVNLTNSGLVLANNGDTVSPAAGATSFTFPNEVDYGTSYDITIQTQPNHMTCTVTYGSGSAGHTVEIAATVTCVQNSYAVGGTISGLSVAGLVLSNGSDTLTPAAEATTFTMPTAVYDGATYGITVLTQPTGLTCTVANGTGLMGAAAVTNIAVTCVANTTTNET
jgi:hypothetical protein